MSVARIGAANNVTVFEYQQNGVTRIAVYGLSIDNQGSQTADINFSVQKNQFQSIKFEGLSCDDRFENETDIPSIANGGAGVDTLIGGSGEDVLTGSLATTPLKAVLATIACRVRAATTMTDYAAEMVSIHCEVRVESTCWTVAMIPSWTSSMAVLVEIPLSDMSVCTVETFPTPRKISTNSICSGLRFTGFASESQNVCELSNGKAGAS